ncbi:MAG: hypothetical protein HONBIEJF_02603 [Fimbriimonadaceae bacterium]|nr:hypothetical protein [Fimbriimonadaceae bacterium]
MPKRQYHIVDGRVIGETSGGVRTDYLRDALGSVTGTVNQSAQVRNTYRWKPYGSLLASTGADPDPGVGWNGTWGYRPTGRLRASHYVFHRHYDQLSGQWTSPTIPLASSQYQPFRLPSTLADAPTRDQRTCAQILKGRDPCVMAQKLKVVKEKKAGGIICCDGKKIICTWIPPGTPYGDGVRECTIVHESEHILDTVCPELGLEEATYIFEGAKAQSECRAYAVSIPCLLRNMGKFCRPLYGSDRQGCIDYYWSWIMHGCALMDSFGCMRYDIPFICGKR